MKISAHLHQLVGGTLQQRKDFEEGVHTLIETLNTQKFKDRVLEYSYKNMDDELIFGFRNSEGLTNMEIYVKLMLGKDKFNIEEDQDIDISANLYSNRWSSTVGYTYPGSYETYINTAKWLSDRDLRICGIASNIIHEYLHNVGFDHSHDYHPLRDHTVPYAVGSIVYQLILEDKGLTNQINNKRPSYWTRIKRFFTRWF